eukprot:ANDGO_04052.mRNA.1 Enhanced ethylene response protein 5
MTLYFKSFVDHFVNAVQSLDSVRVAFLLDFRRCPLHDSFFDEAQRNLSSGSDLFSSSLSKSWAEALSFWMQGCVVLAEGHANSHFRAFERFVSCFRSLVVAFEKESSWMLQSLYTVMVICRKLAFYVIHSCSQPSQVKQDARSESTANMRDAVHTKIKEYVDDIRTCIRYMNQDRSEGPSSKSEGLLHASIELLRVQFKLRYLGLAKTTVQMFLQEGARKISSFPLEEQVVFSYYKGRLDAFECNLSDASEALMFAFERIPSYSLHRSRSLVLRFLLPLQIARGWLPAAHRKDIVVPEQYRAVVEAIRTSSPRLFQGAIDQHINSYMDDGMYVIIERLRLILYRNCFKKIYLGVRKFHPACNKLPLAVFRIGYNALMATEGKLSNEEVESVMGLLISHQLVKGYISHAKQFVVFSNNGGFPRLSTLSLKL